MFRRRIREVGQQDELERGLRVAQVVALQLLEQGIDVCLAAGEACNNSASFDYTVKTSGCSGLVAPWVHSNYVELGRDSVGQLGSPWAKSQG